MKPHACLATFFLFLAPVAFACTAPVSVCDKPSEGSFALISKGRPATLLVEAADADSAVIHAQTSFAEDLLRVSGSAARQVTAVSDGTGAVCSDPNTPTGAPLSATMRQTGGQLRSASLTS